MSRLVRFFAPTWQDRFFRKAAEKLSPREREQRAGQAAALVKALQACSHPVTDPRLQPWRPSAYRGVIQAKDGYLVEYRFPGVMRVVACCFDGPVDAPHPGLVLLLTITLDHDHERMKKLIRQSSTDILQEGQAFLEQGPDDPPEPP